MGSFSGNSHATLLPSGDLLPTPGIPWLTGVICYYSSLCLPVLYVCVHIIIPLCLSVSVSKLPIFVRISVILACLNLTKTDSISRYHHIHRSWETGLEHLFGG
jgi:hypothetical protein